MTGIKVKFIGIRYDNLDKVEFVTNVFTENKFELREVEIKIGTYISKRTETIKEQADEYILEMDKTSIMTIRNLLYILDWEVLKVVCGNVVEYRKESKVVETKADKMKKALKEMSTLIKPKYRDKFMIDFLACYKNMSGSVSKLSVDKQIKITLDAMHVGYLAGIESLDKLQASTNKFKEELKSKRLKDE